MKTKAQPAKIRSSRHGIRDATFYGAVACSAIVGVAAFESGASIEGALIRVAVTLLACTALGYLLSIILLLAGSSAPVVAGQPAVRETGRVDLSVGDDDRDANGGAI